MARAVQFLTRRADTSTAGALLGQLIMDRRRLTSAGTSAAHDVSRLTAQRTDNTARENTPSRDTQRTGRESLPRTGTPEPRIERIARRAHELYEARGGTDGRALEDWLQAEREIDAEP
jgi:hypothetical protein